MSLPSSKVVRLHDRALALKNARFFFDQRKIIEVDCPIISSRASIDAHIDLISAFYRENQKRYLHSSPEFGMKRLLAEGMGDIYQLAHVFRDGEYSVKHNPEFMMAEWYRCGFNLTEMMIETADFIRAIIGNFPHYIISYREALIKYTGIDYLNATINDLCHYIENTGLSIYPEALEEGKDGLLNIILGTKVEPFLGQNQLCILAYYPASQAALAQKLWFGEEQVAERFEIYFNGLELANGYHELTDAKEQRYRFEQANLTRKKLGKSILPIDEYFLESLEKGLPDCCGVAVGFDRLMMIRQKQGSLSDVITWDWDLA